MDQVYTRPAMYPIMQNHPSSWEQIHARLDVIKQESVEESHNDSGISRGPGSTSGDSNPSPPRHPQVPSPCSDRESTSPDPSDPLKNLEIALQRVQSQQSPSRGSNKKPFRCPLCDFDTADRSDFNNHLVTHCQTKCHICEFNGSSSGELRAHLKESHQLESPAEVGNDEDPDWSTPRVNSQGKVKTYRCKECSFIAVIKNDYYEHKRQFHIRADKQLTCPKCPFVTEYKHHMEYHLLNHAGSKPYKCDQCDYSCVNKSMLNSHLKSHSSIHQYRCADCNYATKYCHSLKIHLRRHRHQPGKVLNADGTENTCTIIDVYGHRRGPKQKQKLADNEPIPVKKDAIPQQIPSYSMYPQNHFLYPQLPFHYSNFVNKFLGNSHINGNFPYNNIIPNLPFNGDSPTSQPNDGTLKSTSPIPAFPYGVNQDSTCFEKEEPQTGNMPPLDAQFYHPSVNNNNNNNIDWHKIYIPPAAPPSVKADQVEEVKKSEEVNQQEDCNNPIDLSKSQVEESVAKVQPVSTGKSRRKGKACKLEQIVMRLQYQSDSGEEMEDVSTDRPESRPRAEESAVNKAEKEFSSEVTSMSDMDAVPNNSALHHCKYCDLTFKDAVMYTVHTGFHAADDPLRCNMCRQKMELPREFFVHVSFCRAPR